MRLNVPLALLLLSSCGNFAYLNNPFFMAPHLAQERWTPTKHENYSITKVSTFKLPEITTERGPLVLAELVDFALTYNPETASTWANARIAAATYAESLGTYFPTIIGSFNYDRTKSVVFDGNTALETYSTTWGPAVSLAYTIYDFGERSANAEAALQSLYFANQTHNRTIETVVRNVAFAYFDYLYQLALLISLEEDIVTAEETLREAIHSREAGVKSISDELQAKTSYLSKKTEASQQQQRIRESLSILLQQLGTSPDQIPDLKPMPKTLPDMIDLPTLDDAKEMALSQRADYLAQKNQVLSKKETLVAAQRAVLPTIDYNFAAQRNLPAQGVPINTSFNSELSLSFPVFAGFIYRNAIKQALAAVEVASSSLLEMELSVIQEVVDAHSNVIISYQTAKFAQEFLSSAEETYQVSFAQYQNGVNNIVDVLVSQSGLANARAEYVKTLKDWYVSLIDLSYALGNPNPTKPLKEELP